MKRIIVFLILLVASPLFAEERIAWIGIATAATGGGTSGSEIIGNDDVTTGDSNFIGVVGSIICSGLDTPTVGQTWTVQTISILSANVASEDNDITLGVYTDSGGTPNALVGSKSFTDIGDWSTGWKEWDVSSEGWTLTGGSPYWLCRETSASIIFYYNTGAAGSRHYDTNTYGTAWGATFTSNSSSTGRHAIKATITY